MAEVYIRVIKQPDRAIAPLRQAIALKKDHFYAHVNLGMVYRETGNYEEARAALQKALQLASKNPGLAQEAAAYIKEMEQHQLVQTQLKTLAKVGQAQEFKGQLTKTDPLLDGKHSKIYPLQLKAGKHYLIDLMSSEFDTYLMVKNAAGKLIAEEDNSGQGTDSKLLFVPETDGEYTIVVLAFEAAATGSYTLRIQEYQPAKREKPPMD